LNLQAVPPFVGSLKEIKKMNNSEINNNEKITAIDSHVAEAQSKTAVEKNSGVNKNNTFNSFFNSVCEKCIFFHTPEGEAYVTILFEKHVENIRIRSRTFARFIRQYFFEAQGEIPSRTNCNQILDQCEAIAQFRGEEHQVHIRIARHQDIIFIDMADDKYRQIRIDNKGWKIIPSKLSPVKFIRHPRMAAMNSPAEDGSLYLLNEFLNLANANDGILVGSWLVGALQPEGPFPILLLQGEQGSAKSTLARLLVDLIDPSCIPLCTFPRTERDLFISSSKTRLLSFDNLSGISDQLSDAFCRMSTGGGFATRSLFTDDSEKFFNSKRPIIINGISDLLTRHDFSDRSIVINTAPIPQNKRRPENKIWSRWEEVKPRILGALCDAISAAMRNYDKVNLANYPRMADFAHWVVAAESALPWGNGAFLEEYLQNRAQIIDIGLEADPVGSSVLNFIKNAESNEWSGTPTGLLVELNKIAPEHFKRLKSWPKQPNVLSGRLRRSATFLREKNFEIEWSKSGQRNITLRKITETPSFHEQGDGMVDYAQQSLSEITLPSEKPNQGLTLTEEADPLKINSPKLSAEIIDLPFEAEEGYVFGEI